MKLGIVTANLNKECYYGTFYNFALTVQGRNLVFVGANLFTGGLL